MASTLFRNLRLFDGLADSLAEGIEILVEGDRIKEVADTPIASAAARVVDCAGRTLMPGLIDAHVHAYGVDADLGRLDRLPRSLQALRAAERLKDSLKRGFTSIRDAGGADWGLAIAIETGLITAPGCSTRAARCRRPAAMATCGPMSSSSNSAAAAPRPRRSAPSRMASTKCARRCAAS